MTRGGLALGLLVIGGAAATGFVVGRSTDSGAAVVSQPVRRARFTGELVDTAPLLAFPPPPVEPEMANPPPPAPAVAAAPTVPDAGARPDVGAPGESAPTATATAAAASPPMSVAPPPVPIAPPPLMSVAPPPDAGAPYEPVPQRDVTSSYWDDVDRRPSEPITRSSWDDADRAPLMPITRSSFDDEDLRNAHPTGP